MKISIFLINFAVFLVLACWNSALAEESEKLRLISISPGTTEILYSLGLGDNILAVSSSCNYPEAALSKPRIGSFSNANIEMILHLRPDIVFATGLEQAESVKTLRSLGVKVIVSHPKNMQELFDSIRKIGRATARPKEAEILVRDMQNKLKGAAENRKNIKRPSVFVEIWSDPLMTVGRNSFVAELISLAGGENIAYDAPRPYSRFNPEIVIRRNPDFIILSYMTNNNAKEKIKTRLGWRYISAIKNDNIIADISPDLLLRPGPRTVEAVEKLSKIFNK